MTAREPNLNIQRMDASRSAHFQFLLQRQLAPTADARRYRDMKLHSILLGWSDLDQALRVAAGILGERASGGLTQLGSAARGAKPSRQCIEPGSLNPG